MRAHPNERFLGVPAGAGAWTLLGLDFDVTLDAPLIDRAVKARLMMVNRHPGADSADAAALRKRLTDAAAELREQIGKEVARPAPTDRAHAAARSSPRTSRRAVSATRGARPGITLTDFDRQVLGTLVGCGGWNHASRSRLVSIAAAHRVTVHGLLTVIRGLNDYARSGGARLDVATITAGRGMLTPASVDLPRRGPSLAERLLPELKEPTPATTVKWSLIFGLATVALGGALILLAVRGGGSPAVPPPVVDNSPPPAIAQQDDAGAQQTDELDRTPATFPQPPTFAVTIDELVDRTLLEQAARLPEELDHIARRVRVSDEPAEAVFREWDVLIQTASSVWPALDEPFNRQVAAGVKRIFEEAIDKPAASERLLDSIGVGAGQLVSDDDVWRSAWRIERLAELAQSLRLTPRVRERCELMLSAALARAVDTRTRAPGEIASQWLGDITTLLVDRTESSDSPYALWGRWLVAVDRLTEGEATNAAIAAAVEAILRSNVALTHQGAAVNVLGRLLEELDWRGSAVTRERLSAWFDDAGSISSEDLWVLTSIVSSRDLAQWFEADHVLPAGADAAHRRRLRDQIASAWPRTGDADGEAVAGPAGRALDVDPKLGADWREMQASLLAVTPVSAPQPLVEHLALLARLNEAATLLEQGDTLTAERVMNWIADAHAMTSVLEGRSPLSAPRGPFGARQGTRQPGQPIGQDGVWAAAYAQAGTAADARINLIRSLRSTAGTDLGPVDAATFVREVYRATPAEVRAMAQAVALIFSDGPNVSLQLLDQLPDAIPNEDTSEFLSRFTARAMPPARSERWRIETRLMLIEHALALMRSSEGDIDRAAEIVADAVARQTPAAMPELTQQAAIVAPEEAASLVRQAWADAMRRVVVAEPVPGDFPSLERRHRTRMQLADGPIQSFVANRVGHLEWFAFALTAEQPALRVSVAGMLEESAAMRAQLPDAIQQAIEIERMLARLHALRMRDRDHESDADDNNGGGGA